MSWDRTYTYNLLIALDRFAAALIFNEPDLTVSTLCYFVLTGDYGWLKLSGFQLWLLRKLGPALDRIQKDHCKLAALSDLARASMTSAQLLRLYQIRRLP